MLTIALLIILSPVILIAGLFSLFIILAMLNMLISSVKQVIKCQKQEDQQNTIKNTAKK